MWGALKSVDAFAKNLFGGSFLNLNIKSSPKSDSSESFFCNSNCTRRTFFLKLFAASIFLSAAQSAQALVVKGTNYVSLSELGKRFGMSIKTVEARKSQRLYNKWASLTFEIHRRDVLLNGNKIWLGFPVVEYKGMLYIASADVSDTLVPILYPKATKYMPSLRTIVIDAGHGGKDKGAISKSYGLYEKDLTLDIALRLAKILRLKGYKIYLTRSSDKFLELQDRPSYANKLKADMFLSIHINAAGASASGIETFSLTPSGQNSTNASGKTIADKRKFIGNSNDDWNTLLAHYIQKDMVSGLSAEDRGSKRARFVVLQDTKMPAALIECGFISNNSDIRKLSSPVYRQKLANAIANGVFRYANTLVRLKKTLK